MSNFDSFQARVDRLKAETDQEIATDRTARSFAGSGTLGSMLKTALVGAMIQSIGWLLFWVAMGAICVAALAVALGISFKVALTLVVVGFVVIAGFIAANR